MSDVPILLCSLAGGSSPFKDNVQGQCVDCGVDIMWRPHAPAEAERVCLSCGSKRIEAIKQTGDVPEYVVTKETDTELRALGYELREGTKH